MTSSTEVSPTIFDRLLGFAHTPGFAYGLPKGGKPREEFRFYTCYKGMNENPNAWTCIQRGMGFFDIVHTSPKMEEYNRKDVRVCAYNPQFFDPVVLSGKVGGAVTVTVNPK